MAIKWRSSMSVSNREIDKDHQTLIALINTVEEELNSDQKSRIEETLLQLEKYTDEHFSREERLMRQTSYPGYFQHFKEHHNLKNQLKSIKKNILIEMDNEKNYDSLINILRMWLLDHVLKEDLQMKPYLKKLI